MECEVYITRAVQQGRVKAKRRVYLRHKQDLSGRRAEIDTEDKLTVRDRDKAYPPCNREGKALAQAILSTSQEGDCSNVHITPEPKLDRGINGSCLGWSGPAKRLEFCKLAWRSRLASEKQGCLLVVEATHVRSERRREMRKEADGIEEMTSP